MQSHGTDSTLKHEVEQNRKLLEENHRLLKRLEGTARRSFWLQIAWYVFLIGLPFALYFYVLEPYFAAMGSSYETFNAGMQEIPGWKQFYEMVAEYNAEQPPAAHE